MYNFKDGIAIILAAAFAAIGIWEIWKMPLTLSDYVIIAVTGWLLFKGLPLLARYPVGKKK